MPAAAKTGALDALVSAAAAKVKGQVAELKKRAGDSVIGPQHTEKFVEQATNIDVIREAFIADVQAAL